MSSLSSPTGASSGLPGKGDQGTLSPGAGAGGPGVGRRRRRTSRPIPPKLYRIGEVVAYADVSRQTIHNYTTMGLINESSWSAGGHRLYDEGVFGRLDEIADLKSRRKSLHEIRDHFRRLDLAAGSRR